MKLDVIKLDGGKGGSIDLPDDIFGIEDIRGDILQRVLGSQAAGGHDMIAGGRVKLENGAGAEETARGIRDRLLADLALGSAVPRPLVG